MAITIALATFVCPAASARAQSITIGSVTGVVRSTDGVAVPQAIVTLSPLGSDTGQETQTSPSGTFAIGFVQPGAYEIRVEALGYRPLVARVLSVSGGEERNVSLTLTAEPPPVLSVDTVSLGAASGTRWRSGAVQLGANEISSVPHRFEDLASVAALSSAFDDTFGSQGLPGDMTLIIADGLPFYRAPHPTAREELIPTGLFPASELAGVTAFHNASDTEWTGSAGGYVGVATRASTSGRGIEVDGAYSGGPLWSSSELDISKPTLTSYRGGLRATVPLSPNVSQLVVSAEVLHDQTPLAPRINDGLAADLSTLDPDLLTSLTAPAVESYSRYSGLARLDVQSSPTSRVFFRGAGSFSKRKFDGAGPVSLARLAAPQEESKEFSVATGVVNQHSRRTTIEVRGGLSGSSRDFGAAIADRAPAYLVEAAAPLGGVPSGTGKSSRLDFSLVPVVRVGQENSLFEFGATIRASRHTMDHSAADMGDLVYSDASALLAGRGYGRLTTAPEVSFGTQEYGVFAGFQSDLGGGVQLNLGGRYDYENVGGDGVTLNTDWEQASGLANTVYPTSFHQLGARGSLAWEPVGSGTRVDVTGSIHEGDVDTRAFYGLFAETGAATSSTFAGNGLNWPTDPLAAFSGSEQPTLTLLGPDTRAPRTANVDVGIAQRVGQSVSLYVRGSTRRTDFLMRRRNLNTPTATQSVDPNGRNIFGTLVQDGSLVTATGADTRRFSNFAEVWALDPDGWSEYVGFTAGLEHSSQTLELYASYTYSETTDNWVGAASGSLGGTLRPGLPVDPESSTSWSEGTSDFDAPHRAAGGLTIRAGAVALSGGYRFRSGLPFTPRYRLGVDANGDGSIRNDVAFVPGDAQIATLLDSWACLDGQIDGFAVRNSCRGPSRHSVNVRLSFRLGVLAGRSASITVDGIDLIESADGVIDDALMLVDPSGTITTSADGSMITIPTMVNPDFGRVLYPFTRGRVIRVGVRVGG